MQEISGKNKAGQDMSDRTSRRCFLVGCLLAGVAYTAPSLFTVNTVQAASRPSHSRPSRRSRPSRHSRPSYNQAS